VPPLHGEWHLRTFELIDQHGKVELPDVVTAEVIALQVRRQAPSNLTEGLLNSHVGVGDAVDACGFGRNRDAGVQAAGLDLVGPSDSRKNLTTCKTNA